VSDNLHYDLTRTNWNCWLGQQWALIQDLVPTLSKASELQKHNVTSNCTDLVQVLRLDLTACLTHLARLLSDRKQNKLVDDNIVRIDAALCQFLYQSFRLKQRQKLGNAYTNERRHVLHKSSIISKNIKVDTTIIRCDLHDVIYHNHNKNVASIAYTTSRILPLMLWHCWLSSRKDIQPLKPECRYLGGGDLTGALHLLLEFRFAPSPSPSLLMHNNPVWFPTPLPPRLFWHTDH